MHTVFIADDHKILRDGLRSLIIGMPEFDIIGEAEDGISTVKQVKKLQPDIVVIDISMPLLNGVDATHKIVTTLPETKVLALSMVSDHQTIKKMFDAGASGYLLKKCAFEELSLALNSVVAGNKYLSPSITHMFVEGDFDNADSPDSDSMVKLTSRERETLQLVAEGRSISEISEILHISRKTVETHRSNLMKKLNMFSIAELTKYALKQGLTTL